jgi:hypothetical protein
VGSRWGRRGAGARPGPSTCLWEDQGQQEGESGGEIGWVEGSGCKAGASNGQVYARRLFLGGVLERLDSPKAAVRLALHLNRSWSETGPATTLGTGLALSCSRSLVRRRIAGVDAISSARGWWKRRGWRSEGPKPREGDDPRLIARSLGRKQGVEEGWKGDCALSSLIEAFSRAGESSSRAAALEQV